MQCEEKHQEISTVRGHEKCEVLFPPIDDDFYARVRVLQEFSLELQRITQITHRPSTLAVLTKVETLERVMVPGILERRVLAD